MSQKTYYCVNHPGVVATDVCSRCGKRICYNCRIEAFGRIFCSTHCVVMFMFKKALKDIFSVFKKLMKLTFWPFRMAAKFSWKNWAVLILGLGVITSLYFLWTLSREIKSLKTKPPEKEIGKTTIDTSKIPPPKIFRPTRGGMVFSNTLSIAGEADDNRIVSLSINGKLIRAVLPKNGKFKFERIQLRRGDNRLEVRAITEDGKVSTLQTLVLTYASPTLRYLSKSFTRGPLNRKEVALTFDGGSINNAAKPILDILREKNVKCTFFLTGEFIRRYPDTVRRIAAEGHEVGNHTWNHPHLTTYAENGKQNTLPGITPEKIKMEFSKTAALFKVVTGHEMVHFWRAPYGEYNKQILMWAAQAGYKHVGWTVGRGWENTMDTFDWVADKNSKIYKTADQIAEKILNYAKGKKHGANGIIILMHLGTERKDDFPYKKLPAIIDGLRKEGYRFVKISEMTAIN